MSASLVCDTSGLLAGFDRKHPHHAAVAQVLREEQGPLLVSPLVLTEIDYLLSDRYGIAAAMRFYADLQAGAYELAELTRDNLLTVVEVASQYADMGLGLADASNVVVAERYSTVRMLCIDEHHMRAVRPLRHGAAFTLLPIDNQ